MEKPVTWKMIERHRVYGSMSPGEEVFLEVEQMLTPDINAVMVYFAYAAAGLRCVLTE